MQKVTKFLESYVQWLVLGLGAVWLLWVGYAYWVSKPVAVEIGSALYGPGEIDDYVAQSGGPIDTLAHSLKGEGKTPPELGIFQQKAPQYATLFREDMDLKSYTPPALATVVPVGKRIEGPVQTAKAENLKRSLLPVLVADTIKPIGVTSGLSVAFKPDPKVPVNPADTTQKTIVNPNEAAAKPIALVPAEISWVTVLAKVDMKKLAEAFTKAEIPEQAAFTQYLRVNLVREELMADGTWGNQKIVDDLSNQFKPHFPPTADDEGPYIDWSQKSVTDIIQPPFYEFLRGDVWRTSSMPIAVADTADPQAVEFDPATVKDVSKLTPEQKKKWMEYKATKQKEDEDRRKSEAEQRRNRTPRGPGGEGRRGASGAPRPDDSQRLAPPTNRRQTRGRRPIPGTSTEGNIGRPTPGSGTAPYNPAQGGGELPAGAFAPASAQDMEIWAHDDSTQPGHTYRYKLQVYFKNPLFVTQGMALNVADEAKLAIAAESAWSEKVISPRKQYFFASTGGDTINSNNPKMKFEYFYWEDGEWKTKTFDVHPGDAIGATPWTVVDFRPAANGNENRALLVNDLGELDTRFYKADIASPDYKRLHGLIKPPPAAAANAQ
jgi:hypothetical protein